MQYAHAIKRISLIGTSFNAAEIWSTSFYVGSVGADCSNPTQTFADAVRTAWTTFFQDSNVSFSNLWKTTTIKVAQINTDGTTSLSNVVYAPYGTAIAGNNTGNKYPPQVALAATLEVAGARGLASKGRMYLPGIAQPLEDNGTLSSANSLKVVNGFKTFMDAVNTAAPTGEDVILASQGNRVKNSEGVYVPVPGTAVNAVVNRVKVGSVYDTQRRRRNDLVEVYQTATLA